MSPFAYYEGLKALAREKRMVYGVSTTAFGLRDVRRIYSAEGVRIDYWPLSAKVKAVYMCEDGDCSVAINKSLPDIPKLFALLHELKHHYRDQDAMGSGGLVCGDYNANRLIEIGAEVFAAEFIYPEQEFVQDAKAYEGGVWTAETVVRFKRCCRAAISFTFLCKRLERIGFIARGQFDGVRFRKLEEQIFGVPFYRRRPASKAS